MDIHTQPSYTHTSQHTTSQHIHTPLSPLSHTHPYMLSYASVFYHTHSQKLCIHTLTLTHTASLHVHTQTWLPQPLHFYLYAHICSPSRSCPISFHLHAHSLTFITSSWRYTPCMYSHACPYSLFLLPWEVGRAQKALQTTVRAGVPGKSAFSRPGLVGEWRLRRR